MIYIYSGFDDYSYNGSLLEGNDWTLIVFDAVSVIAICNDELDNFVLSEGGIYFERFKKGLNRV